MSRDKIDPPEELREQIEARFGRAANSRAEMYLTALWYAVERYDAEHGLGHSEGTDVQQDSDAEE